MIFSEISGFILKKANFALRMNYNYCLLILNVAFHKLCENTAKM